MERIEQIIKDAITASEVLSAQGDQVLAVAVAQSIGAGIVNNCDFHLQKLTDHGLLLHFSEGKDGRMVVRVVDA